MKYFGTLAKLGCFNFKTVLDITGNENTANSMLRYYKKNGAIKQIKKGLYTILNPIDNEPLADKYLIGTKINNTAVISHHSAFEYYGCANQVSYRVFVSSESKFNTFEFMGNTYTRIPMNIKAGIDMVSGGARVTDMERTVLDSICDFEKSMGFEELIRCISLVPVLNENKLLLYLAEYDKCFLYQKTGFILEHFNDNFDLSEAFFQTCRQKFGSSSRYLLKDTGTGEPASDGRWRLTIPRNLWNMAEGCDLDADI